jgi:hypothetical protein
VKHRAKREVVWCWKFVYVLLKGSKHEGRVAPNVEGLRPRGLRPQDLRPQGLRQGPTSAGPTSAGPTSAGPTAGSLRPYEVYSSLLKTAETGRLMSTNVD